MQHIPGSKSASNLKLYPASNAEHAEWIVSGPSKNEGKRWRRRFESKELAEEFFNRETEKLSFESCSSPSPSVPILGEGIADASPENSCRGEELDDSRKPKETSKAQGVQSHSKYSYGALEGKNSRRSISGVCSFLLTLCVVLLGYAIDWKLIPLRNRESAVAIYADFEANPLLSGWSASGPGADWTEAEHVSGRAALSVRGANWESRLVEGVVGGWFRLAFRSKGLGGVPPPPSNEARGCVIVFSDGSGKPVGPGLLFEVQRATRWRMNEFWFRTQPSMDSDGNLKPMGLKIRLEADERDQFFVDELVLEKVTKAEVAGWADGFYGRVPLPLNYTPGEKRWERIPRVMAKLNGHQKVRIVVIGDEIQQELANAPIDLFFERSYPGSAVEIIPLFIHEMSKTGGSQNLKGLLTSYKPDLIVFGGMLDEDDMPVLQNLVKEVRVNDNAARKKTEMLILTCGWGSTVVKQKGPRFSSDMRELNQEVAMNPSVPNDMRGQLLRFAEANGIGFLDMMGILSEFIYRAASAANSGPATAADGVPYGFWTRDWIHPAEIGKHLMGRILESYFAPAKAIGGKRSRHDRSPTMSGEEVRTRDWTLLIEAKRKFQISPTERPVFVKTFERGDIVGDDDVRSEKPLTFRLGNDVRREVGFNFDDPADLRQGDVAVYWSFSSDRSVGEERSKVAMHLCFTDPGKGGRHDRAHVSLIVRPGGVSLLSVGGELLAEQGVEHPVEVPVENFFDVSTEAKFRLVLRRTGSDRVIVEASSWSSRTKRWEGFTPHDRPGAPPLTMELSTSRNLLGTATFKSIFFEMSSDVPRLGAALVTVRPSLVR